MMTQEPLEDIEEISLEPYGSTAAASDKGAEDESQLSLLSASNDDDDVDDSEVMVDRSMSKAQVWGLYTTHILSTWNARTYEFAAILFTASAYPDTLLASSLRGIFNTTASICFSSLLGVWIDRAPSRLRTLLTTIFANRCAVLLACICWVFLVDDGGVGVDEQRLTTTNPSFSTKSLAATLPSPPAVLKNSLFALAVFLGTLEKLSGVANIICMERDWIPVLASQTSDASSSIYDLTQLNAAMRRIDLICKLVAPVLISVIISATKSTRLGVYVVAGMSVVSWPADYICARRVYFASAHLRQRKPKRDVGRTQDSALPTPTLSPNPPAPSQTAYHLLHATTQALAHYTRSLRAYFSTPVWQPSLALAILHLSVLSYSATFLTYLLDTGFSLLLITVVRALSSVVEVASTLITPWGVRYLSRPRPHRQQRLHRPRSQPDTDLDTDIDIDTEAAGVDATRIQTQTLLADERVRHAQTTTTKAANGTGLERLGLWGISSQFVTTIPVVFALWQLSPSPSASASSSSFPSPLIPRSSTTSTTTNTPLLPIPILTTLLFLSLSLTRLGLWTFDLTTQELTQTRVPASQRSSFAGTEMSFVAVCELAHWVLAAVFSRPEQFRYLAGMSLGAVGAAAGLYAGWVRGRRGHLLHLGLDRWDCGKGRGWGR